MEDADPAARSVASWLGVLFALLFLLNSLGGWVRISGCGVAIPAWPLVDGSLLPPFTAAGWEKVRAGYDADQARLRLACARGELAGANLGREPRDAGDFRLMFLTEWMHRLCAALVAVVALGCLTVAFRRREVARRVSLPLAAAGLLIVAQALLGGLLVAQGTGTHWLFLHQGNAAAIMACILVALLRLLAGAEPAAEVRARRRAVRALAHLAVAAVWCQLVAGALVAGSRCGGVFRSHALSQASLLWRHDQPLAWNLLDNADLHQWLHRTAGWLCAVLLAALYLAAWRAQSALGQRARYALAVSATFLPLQLLLGLADVEVGCPPFLSLAHQFLGMCLFLSLVLAFFDLAHERNQPSTSPLSNVDPTTP